MSNSYRWRSLFCGVLASTILLSGCGGSNNNGFVVTTNQSAIVEPTADDSDLPDVPVTPPDAPVANPDTFVSLGNGTLDQSAQNGLIANDEVNGGTVLPFQGSTNSGGTVSIASDGSFTYSPPLNFLGTDRFEYTLSNETGSSTAGAVVIVSSRGYFVNTAAAVNGDGSQGSPFDNITDAFNATQYGDTVFVFAPSTINGTINLPRGVNLVGEGAGLIAAQTLVAPGTAPTLEGPVVMVSDSVVSGFTIGGGSQGVVSTNAHNITVRGNEFQASINEHVRVQDPYGPIAIESNTFRDPSANQDAVNVFYTDGNQTVTVDLNDNLFTSDGTTVLGSGIHITTPTSQVHTYNISRNTFTGNSSSTSYANAIFVEAQSASSDDVNIKDNTISRMQSNGIFLLARNGGQILADVLNNSVSECGENNVLLRGDSGAEGTVNLFGNAVLNSAGDGLRLDFLGAAEMRYVISGNEISGSADDGVFVERRFGGFGTALIQGNTFADNAGDGVEGTLVHQDSTRPQQVALRDNTFTGSGGEDARFSLSQGSFTACFDISNNIFSSDLSLTQINSVLVNIERLDEGLDSINTFLSGVPTVTGTNVSSTGDCNID